MNNGFAADANVENHYQIRIVEYVITAKHLRELMTAEPFKPFRVHLSDGSTYDITHHDMAIVEQNTLDIGLNRDDDGIAQRLVRCAILHVVKLEDLVEPATR